MTSPPAAGSTSGELALVLHTHVPWLVGHGTWPVGEEWLFQAWGTAWYPVTDMLCRLASEGHRDVLSLGVTPMVAAQVSHRRMRDEMGTWLGGQMWRAEEQRRSALSYGSELAALGPFHWRHHADLLAIHERVEAAGGLLAVWRTLADEGVIEILGGPATHPYLPLLSQPALVDAQLAAGQAGHAEWLGAPPTGMWPPELGYRPAGRIADPARPALQVDRHGTPTLHRSGGLVPGLETHYSRHGVDHVMVDGPTLIRAAGGTDRDWTVRPTIAPHPVHASGHHPDDIVHDGVRIGDSDVIAFARDLSVAYHVWSPTRGYPGHPDYLDFHARGAFDLHPSWRITGTDVDMWDKQVYDPSRVAAAVAGHVDHFLDVVHSVTDPRDGALVVAAAYDTELFGHWWFEGPTWLEGVLRRVQADPNLVTTTLASRARRRPPTRRLHLAESSWGLAKGHASWATPPTRPIWRRVRAGESDLVAAIQHANQPDRLPEDVAAAAVAVPATEALGPAVRAWSQLAASDWPFMVTRGSTPDYGLGRVEHHANELAAELATADPDPQAPPTSGDARTPPRSASAISTTTPPNPGVADASMSTKVIAAFVGAARATLDAAPSSRAQLRADLPASLAHLQAPAEPGNAPHTSTSSSPGIDGSTGNTARPRRILVLSWEYPPRIMGGLGRHVDALTAALAHGGHEVVVITAAHDDAPSREVRDGVDVVRVGPANSLFDPREDLVPWVLDFNLRVQTAGMQVWSDTGFDLVHAHDWLVGPAAVGLASTTGAPVVATLHATEHGRHQGHLPDDRSRWIHQVEWSLTNLATRVITCSEFMADQIVHLFNVDRPRLAVIPNGVQPDAASGTATQAASLRDHLLGTTSADRSEPGDSDLLVACAGRLEWEKGVQDLVAALPRIQDVHAGRVHLAIAGVGSQCDELQAAVAEIGMRDQVTFLGFLSPARVATLHAAADVVAAPSLYEPFGMMALEATAAGTPIVVGDTGGLAELAAAGVGVPVPPGDPDELARAIIRMADPEQAAAVVTAGTRTLANHDWDLIARETAGVMASALTSPPHRPNPSLPHDMAAWLAHAQ